MSNIFSSFDIHLTCGFMRNGRDSLSLISPCTRDDSGNKSHARTRILNAIRNAAECLSVNSPRLRVDCVNYFFTRNPRRRYITHANSVSNGRTPPPPPSPPFYF